MFIEKAIDKAKGGGGEDFAPARYEGYGPGGSMGHYRLPDRQP